MVLELGADRDGGSSSCSSRPRGRSSNRGGTSHRHLRPETGLKASCLPRARLHSSLAGEAWECGLEDREPPLLGTSLESGGVASVGTSRGRPCLEARMEWDLTALRAQASGKAEDI